MLPSSRSFTANPPQLALPTMISNTTIPRVQDSKQKMDPGTRILNAGDIISLVIGVIMAIAAILAVYEGWRSRRKAVRSFPLLKFLVFADSNAKMGHRLACWRRHLPRGI